jgi:hypothetical protein
MDFTRFQAGSVIAGKFYVCHEGGLPLVCRLAGPFECEAEAIAAAAALEAESSEWRMQTEIWQSPVEESDPDSGRFVAAPVGLSLGSGAVTVSHPVH